MPTRTLSSFNGDGEFQDLGEVGHGFSGLVLKSRHLASAQIVARKIIHETARKRAEMQEPSTAVASALIKEISIYNQIGSRESEYVIRCLGILPPGRKGHIHGGLVFEFMDLGSLQDLLLAKRESLPEPVILKIAHSLFQAGNHLHSLGLLHRDIKPSNILFNSAGQVKLCDFGEAASLKDCQDTQKARFGSGGSLAYMAPERLANQIHGTAADVWSIGVVLLEMALGRYPFASAEQLSGSASSFSDNDCSVIELWETVMGGDADDTSFPPQIDSDKYSVSLAALISACLQRDAAKRPIIDELLKHSIWNDRATSEELVAFLNNR